MTNIIREAVVTAKNDGETRDTIIIKLVAEHGLTLNAATKQYATVAKAEGWTSITVSHKVEALVYLDQYADNWTVATVKDCVLELVEEFEIAESTARDYCKAFSKQLGMDHPSEDPRELMFAWMKSNIDMPRDDFRAGFKAYAKDELGRSPSNINEYLKCYEFHKQMVA